MDIKVAEERQAAFQAWLQHFLPTIKQAYQQGEIDSLLYQAWKAGFAIGREEAIADWADHMTRMANSSNRE